MYRIGDRLFLAVSDVYVMRDLLDLLWVIGVVPADITGDAFEFDVLYNYHYFGVKVEIDETK